MTGWKLNFKFEGKGTVIDLEYDGAAEAIRLALGLTWATVGPQLTRRLGEGRLPEGLGEEALMLSAIHGGAPLAAYEGEYLRIRPSAAAAGLSTKVHVEW